jgi:hypothetical protein
MRSLKHRKGIKNRSLTRYKKIKGKSKVLRGGAIPDDIKNILKNNIDTPEINAKIMDYFFLNENELDELSELELLFILNKYKKDELTEPFKYFYIQGIIEEKIKEKNQNAAFDKLVEPKTLEIITPKKAASLNDLQQGDIKMDFLNKSATTNVPDPAAASTAASGFGVPAANGFGVSTSNNLGASAASDSAPNSAPNSAVPDITNFSASAASAASAVPRFDYNIFNTPASPNFGEADKSFNSNKNADLETVKSELETVKSELESKNQGLETENAELKIKKNKELETNSNEIIIKFFKTEFEKTIVANIGNILNSVGLFEVLINKFNESNGDKTPLISVILTKIKLAKDLLNDFYKYIANEFKITDLKVSITETDLMANGAMGANMASYLLAAMFFAGLAGGSNSKQKANNNFHFTLKGKKGKTNKNKSNKMKMKGGELSAAEIAQIPALAININKDIIQQIYLNIELLKHLKDVNQSTIDGLIVIMTNFQESYTDVCKTLIKDKCEKPEEFNNKLVSIFIPGSTAVINTDTDEPVFTESELNADAALNA